MLRQWCRFGVVFATLVGVPPLVAQTPNDAIRIEVAGATRLVSAAELRARPQDTVRARAHEGPEQVFVGPTLASVLAFGGARLDSLRGRALAQYVLVEARDAYRVVFSVAELSSGFARHRIILARTMDGQPLGADDGPWRVIVEDDLRPARWIRQVMAVRLRAASE